MRVVGVREALWARCPIEIQGSEQKTQRQRRENNVLSVTSWEKTKVLVTDL